MKLRPLILLASLCAPCLPVVTGAEEPRYRILFNGETLDGWKGLDGFWSVQAGSIVGETTAERPTQGNTFLVWQGGEVGDFEFVCRVRFQGNNSGVQYRSALVDAAKSVVAGYQADLHAAPANFGMLYGEKMGKRGIIANRGQQVTVNAAGEKSVVGKVGSDATLVDWEWNELRVVASGNRLVHQINGITTVDVTDDHPEAPRRGILALQLHAGPPMRVEFRDLRLRELAAGEWPVADSRPAEPVAAGTGADSGAAADDWLVAQPVPSWIWAPDTTPDQVLHFRRTFEVSVPVLRRARLYATCDNRLKLFLNGKPVGESPDWPQPIERDVTALIQPGRNVLAAEARNAGGSAAFVLKLEIDSQRERLLTLVTDAAWKLSASAPAGWETAAYDDSTWTTGSGIRVAGSLGVEPWGVPGRKGGGAAAGSGRDALDPLNILTRPGFVVEHVHTVPKAEQGSWVALALHPDGSFYACDQGDKGLFRITVAPSGTKVEAVPVTLPDNPEKPLSGAQGLFWAFDSLWFHRNGGPLYRLRDSDGDGLPETAEVQPSETGGGEHGNHAILLTPDGKALHLVGGNHAKLAAHRRSAVQGWAEDHLFSRMWDARGHARGVLAPGGWVTRFDPETKEQEVVCIGFRNQYDAALNRFGDLFTYDADMEWDMGAPWYRPTRICHVVSGGDFGWRSGSGKWPTYFEDSLPPVVDIGPGSPTGVAAGYGARFPARYQDAIYALDWTFGTIYAIHLTPDGASYRGRSEPFVYGSPLPVTDAVVGRDGHFYFLVGGRGTQSAFFRVRYVGDESTAPSPGNDTPEAAAARDARRRLEAFHGRTDAAALDAAWPHLASADRFLRHAARVAVESQPVAAWADRVLAETRPQALVTGAVALARQGQPAHLAPLLERLLALDPASLDEGPFLGLLRAYQLAFLRLGNPDEALRARVIEELDFHFPHRSGDANTELISLLVHLRAPSVISKTLALIEGRGAPELPDWTELASRNAGYGRGILAMLENHPPSRELGYAMRLRDLKSGWTPEQRRAYFTFLNEAGKGSGGASFPGFVANIRDEALAHCSNEERLALKDITGEDFNPVPTFAILPPQGPGRAWTTDEALAASKRGKANFENGRSLYFSIGCGACHRHAGLGGGVGPDLTSIPNKFDDRYLVEAILEPSKDISDQYGSSVVTLADGTQHLGLAVEHGDKLDLYPPDPKAPPVSLARSSVRSVEPSPVSQMPPGLLNLLNETEVRDLVAYLMSAGNPDDRRFKK
jgi:putative heme-binding domain-containing protein